MNSKVSMAIKTFSRPNCLWAVYFHTSNAHHRAPLISMIKSKRFTLIEINWSILITIHKSLSGKRNFRHACVEINQNENKSSSKENHLVHKIIITCNIISDVLKQLCRPACLQTLSAFLQEVYLMILRGVAER